MLKKINTKKQIRAGISSLSSWDICIISYCANYKRTVLHFFETMEWALTFLTMLHLVVCFSQLMS